MSRLYYIAPSDKCFSELKEKAIKIWATYDDRYGYATEKISFIRSIGNVKDNFMTIVAMFDYKNQARLAGLLSAECLQAVNERMIDGGQPDEYNPFNA